MIYIQVVSGALTVLIFGGGLFFILYWLNRLATRFENDWRSYMVMAGLIVLTMFIGRK